MTTQGMWQMLSELLDGEKLPDSLNKDIYDLCEGKAVVVRELTDAEIWEVISHFSFKDLSADLIKFARAIQKASEKYCNKCNNTGWVCEWHPDKEAHKCCGGAGMPCECTKESE